VLSYNRGLNNASESEVGEEEGDEVSRLVTATTEGEETQLITKAF